MLTSRDRVLMALNHEEPDRVPIFFGTSGVTTLLSPAYDKLKAHLGISQATQLLSRTFQYARLDEEILQRFHSDGRPLLPGPSPSTLRQEISVTEFVDDWGIRWRRPPTSLYYDVAEPPLCSATVDDLASYPWPDLAHPSRFVGLAEQARALHNTTGCALVGMSGVSPFEQAQLLCGTENLLAALIADPEFASALLGKLTDIMLASVTALLAAVGDELDIVLMGDDLGTQQSSVISPALYRKLLKPLHARLIGAVKQHSKAKIFFHSDGNIYTLLGDLIEIGVDILNPVQVSAGAMGDTAGLKRKFGANLSFCGAIDTGWVLPRGTPADVRNEVRRRIADLGPGGGYILASVHCIQPDVPIDNILALFDEALVAGKYPLHL